MADFATINDIIALWRPLTEAEETRAAALLPVVSDAIRAEAEACGKDIEEMMAMSASYTNVVMSVTVDIVVRALRQNTTTAGEPMAQESQSALGYSWSGTYAIPGGSTVPLLRNDLKRLGLRRQKMGVIELYDTGSKHCPL